MRTCADAKVSKCAQNSLFDTFYRDNRRRVRSYCRLFARIHRVDMQLMPDLEQAAWCEAALALRYWRPDGGKTQFNWCAGPMRRGMVRCHRASLGAKAYGTEPLPKWRALSGDRHAGQAADIAARIDLHRALTADPKPKQIVRFIMTALSVSTGSDIARADGICKQVVSEHLTKTKARLRAELSA